MKAKTYVIFNVKGGVGKTVSAIVFSQMLAGKGKKVLLIDLDPSANTTYFFFPNRKTTDVSMKEVFQGKSSLKSAISPTSFANLDLAPSSIFLEEAENYLMSIKNIPQTFFLENTIREIEQDYDYIIIDTAPRSQFLINANAMYAGDKFIVPLRSDQFSLDGLSLTLEIIKTTQQHGRRNPKIAGVFFTAHEDRIVDRKSVIEVEKELKELLLKTSIPKNKDIVEMTTKRFELEKERPQSKATLAYQKIVKELFNL